MRKPTIEISGPEAETIGAELVAWWKEEMGDELRPTLPSVGVPDGDKRGLDPIAVAALVLAVPGAILATADLAKRIELTKKVGRLIAWARSKREQHPKLRIALVGEEGHSVDVAAAEPPDILEALALRTLPQAEEAKRKGAPKAS